MKRSMVFVFALLLSFTVLGQQEAPEMSAEEQEMMANWMAAATPGPQHEMLASMAGEWDVDGKFWMEPGAPPMEAKASATRKMILDGRVLAEHYAGDFMGMKFVGYGLTGYDNQTGQWWGTWNDTFSTSLMTSSGHCTEKIDTCTFFSEGLDPMTGQKMYMKSVFRIMGKDKELMEAYTIAPNGDEIKSMELVYTRKKE